MYISWVFTHKKHQIVKIWAIGEYLFNTIQKNLLILPTYL